MFRKKASERVASPDQLDRMLRVVKPRNWLPLLAVGALLVTAVAWGFLGRIPVTATGKAILVYPSQVITIQSPATGQLLSLDVRVGDEIEEGEELGRLQVSDLKEQLRQARQRLKFFRSRSDKMTDVDKRQAENERRFLKSKMELLETRMKEMKNRAEELKARNKTYATNQRTTISQEQSFYDELMEELSMRVAKYKEMLDKGLTSTDALVDAEERLTQVKLRKADLDLKVNEVDLLEIKAHEDFTQQMDRIDDFKLQYEDARLKTADIDRRLLASEQSKTSQDEEISFEIERLQGLVDNMGTITSKGKGRIIEIAVSRGSIVTKGQRIGAMKIEKPSSRLISLAYFQIRDGKKLKDGMKARVAPSTVQREKFGSIRASISKVSDYLVTLDAAVNEVGNREMAQELTRGGNQIEVRAALELDPDTLSGFKWTSGEGPDVILTAGTTADIRVTIEERAPLTFVLPILKDWLGAQ